MKTSTVMQYNSHGSKNLSGFFLKLRIAANRAITKIIWYGKILFNASSTISIGAVGGAKATHVPKF